jgi:CRP/FNR family transcriptional regulator, cyclic AMP receptor protein
VRVREDSMQTTSGTDLHDSPKASRSREFIEQMFPEAQTEFEPLKVSFNRPANTVLTTEKQAPSSILFLLAGQVKLFMNSSAGRRLILGIANPGETLGLASALSGSRYDITAETLSPCSIAAVNREDFIRFLTRNLSAYKKLARELCLDYSPACEQVRTIGPATVLARLARLLLEWCAHGQMTEDGTRILCSLTHGEIGEFTGASRDTVTRILSDFGCQELLESRGSTLIIPNRILLEAYAGMG